MQDEEPFNPDYVEVDRVLDVSHSVDKDNGEVGKTALLRHHFKGQTREISCFSLSVAADLNLSLRSILEIIFILPFFLLIACYLLPGEVVLSAL